MTTIPGPAPSTAPLGRRERNKAEKLERILDAAKSLLSEASVEDVTTQQVAHAADIGTGTLFLYAKTKGELLLMVQNANYAGALSRGRTAADAFEDPVDAVMAIVIPVIECNRDPYGNGRAYLREMVFGDPNEPHHAAALAIVAETEGEIANALARTAGIDPTMGTAMAHLLSAALLLSMADPSRGPNEIDEVVVEVRGALSIILR